MLSFAISRRSKGQRQSGCRRSGPQTLRAVERGWPNGEPSAEALPKLPLGAGNFTGYVILSVSGGGLALLDKDENLAEAAREDILSSVFLSF